MPHQREVFINTSSSCNHYLVTMDAKENITFCNQNFSNKFFDNTPSSTLSSLLHHDHIHSFKYHFEFCISAPGNCVQGASLLVNQENEHHPIKWEMVAEEKSEGDLNVYLVGHDMQENPYEHNEVESSRKILKAIFDSTDNVKFFISPDYIIRFFNKVAFENALKLHGRRMQIGDSILDYTRDTKNKIEQSFQQDFTKAVKGEKVVKETEVKYKNDLSKWFRTEYYPVYEAGKLLGVSVTVTDLTERKNYEQNIRLQNDKLRKIAFIQSHQVRQPLSNIIGILSFLNTDGMSDDDKYLVKILKLSAEQLDKVVRNIVIEAQQIELYNEFFEAPLTLQQQT